MQLQAPQENHSHGYHSPTYKTEPVNQEQESSSLNHSEKEFFAHGTTYGNYNYTQGYSANPDYSDAHLYGPGQDSPFSGYYAFKKRLPQSPIY